MDKPVLILKKNAEKTTNKIRIPSEVIEELGSKFYMEIYKDKIVLKPILEGE